MDYAAMPTFNDYSEVIAHYENKLNIIDQQIGDVAKSLAEATILVEDGWAGSAANATKDILLSINKEVKVSASEVEEVLTQLRRLRNAIAVQIEQMMAEWKKQQEEAELARLAAETTNVNP